VYPQVFEAVNVQACLDNHHVCVFCISRG
jgi:hypothetical protein